MTAAARLLTLRGDLEKRFGGAIRPLPGAAPAPERGGFRTGVGAIDQLLPGGVPRGALTVWAGEATSGRTAAVRALVDAASRRTLVAVVDGTRTLHAADWCGRDGRSARGVWIARPPAPGHEREGAWVAEALLRTGAFGLVVLDGPAPDATEAHRLRALARETDAALLLSTADAHPGWRADVRLELGRAEGAGLEADGRFGARTAVRLARDTGARSGRREIELVHEPPNRVHPAPLAPDRRPAARR